MMLRAIGSIVFAAACALADQPAITVYNQNFGVVRERVPLTLQAGVNHVEFSEITAHLEPDSIVLRDPGGVRQFQILEQNYRNDPVSQSRLLSLYEGQTIDFLQYDEHAPNRERIVRGKIVRSGYAPPRPTWPQYRQAGGSTPDLQPIIEVEGQLRFGLPGTPLFPALADETILMPTLTWTIASDTAGPLQAELSYVTGGMTWQAAYNIIAPETGDQVDLIGWVTIDNQSGRTFRDAQLKLMAGDVSKIEPEDGRSMRQLARLEAKTAAAPVVTEKAFDEYHLYTLARPTTLRDRETKQVEFVRAVGVDSRRVYIYDGARNLLDRYRGWDPQSLRVQAEIGAESNPDVWVVREFKNTKENQLGIPLPAGKARFYRADNDGRHEFVGENLIDHTPQDEWVRLYTGNAFDIVGERVQTNFQVDHNDNWANESFKITLRNHKRESVTVRIVEHLFRWHSWEIKESSHEFEKKDSGKIEFPVAVPPDGEVTVSYTVHYSW